MLGRGKRKILAGVFVQDNPCHEGTRGLFHQLMLQNAWYARGSRVLETGRWVDLVYCGANRHGGLAPERSEAFLFLMSNTTPFLPQMGPERVTMASLKRREASIWS
jgi:hypothetical protein